MGAVSWEVDGLSPGVVCPLTPAPSFVIPASFGVLGSEEVSSIVSPSSFAPESLTGPVCSCSYIMALACCRCGPKIAAMLAMAFLWTFYFI